jgi:hypothetical protein
MKLHKTANPVTAVKGVQWIYDRATALTLDELRDLAVRIAALIDEREKATAPPPPQPSRVVIEERRTPSATLRLELIKCGKVRCRVCRSGPAHGPYWYAYWKQDGRSRSKYIGQHRPADDYRPPQYLGTYPCQCGAQVAVHDWLPEPVLCRKCQRETEQQEVAAEAEE